MDFKKIIKMKIEIQNNDMSGVYGYTVFDNTSNRTVTKDRGMQPRHFYEDDLTIILNEKQYNQFENGKYEFDISSKILSLVDSHYYKPSFGLDRNYLKMKVEAETIL